MRPPSLKAMGNILYKHWKKKISEEIIDFWSQGNISVTFVQLRKTQHTENSHICPKKSPLNQWEAVKREKHLMLMQCILIMFQCVSVSEKREAKPKQVPFSLIKSVNLAVWGPSQDISPIPQPSQPCGPFTLAQGTRCLDRADMLIAFKRSPSSPCQLFFT